MKKYYRIILFWVAGTALAGQTGFPQREIMDAIRSNEGLTFCGEKVPLEDVLTLEAFEKEFILYLWDRAQVTLWIKRVSRYFPVIEAILRANGLPDDLKYVSVVESALLPGIRSYQGAVGFWQMMENSGIKYGLRIDLNIDQRRNLPRSTQAAGRYLGDLYSMFGSWTSAVAAYNMGENGLLTEIQMQDEENYYKLDLPLETQRFLFKILTTKCILENPSRYGFDIPEKDLYAPYTFDEVTLDLVQDTPLYVIARAAGVSFFILRELNPEFTGYFAPEGIQHMLVPAGCAGKLYGRFPVLFSQWKEDLSKAGYTVKTGDSLSSIAESFHTTVQAILIWNRLERIPKIQPGQRLIVLPGKPVPFIQ